MSKPDLSALSIHDLTTELRSRGCAVAVFSAEDRPSPDEYDWNAYHPDGFQAFLNDKADRMEDVMRECGWDYLEQAACDADVPVIMDDDVTEKA
jgi:O-glycosyl hydrolase